MQDAERWLEPHAATAQMIVVDEAQFRRLPAAVAVHRAGRTLRTHAPSIYSKLGVNNRRAAVRRAEELLRK
jgi:hypothetical protein